MDELGSIKRMLDIHDIDQMVPHLRTLSDRRLGGPDIHAPVNLHGIYGNDFTSQSSSELKSDSRFADTGWPGKEELIRCCHPGLAEGSSFGLLNGGTGAAGFLVGSFAQADA